MQDPAGPALTSGPSAARVRQLADHNAEGLPFIHDLPYLDGIMDWSAITNATRCRQASARPAPTVLGASVPAVDAATGGTCGPQLEYATTAQPRTQPPQRLRRPQPPPSQPQVQPQPQPPRLQSGPDSFMQEQHQPAGASDISPFTSAHLLAVAATAPGAVRPADVDRPCWPWYGTSWPAASARTTPGSAREASARQLPQSGPPLSLQLQVAGVAATSTAAAAATAASAAAGPATAAVLVQIPTAAVAGGAAGGRGLLGRREGSNLGVEGLEGLLDIDNWDIDEQLLSEIALTPWPAAPIQDPDTCNMYGRVSATWPTATAATGAQDDGAGFQLAGLPYVAAAGELQGRPPAQRPTAGAARTASLGHLEINVERSWSLPPPPPLSQRQLGCPLQAALRQPRETAAAVMLPPGVLDQLPYRSSSAVAVTTGLAAARVSMVGACERHLENRQMQSPAFAIWSVSSCGLADGFAQASPFPWLGGSMCDVPSAGADRRAMLPPPLALPSFSSDASTSGRTAPPAALPGVTAAAAFSANSAGGGARGSRSGGDIMYPAAAAEAFEGGGAGRAGSKSAVQVALGAAVQGQEGEAGDVLGAHGAAQVGADALLAMAVQDACGGGRGGPVLAASNGDDAASAKPSKPQHNTTGNRSSSSTRGHDSRGVGSGTSDVSGSDTGGSGAIAPDTREAFLALLRLTYDLPVAAAAAALGVSVTELKRRCRAAGIQRWPSRKLQSLGRILSSTLEDDNLTEQQRQDILTAVARNRRDIFDDPNAPLLSDLKVVRQVQYKQLHGRRHNKPGGAGLGRGGTPRS